MITTLKKIPPIAIFQKHGTICACNCNQRAPRKCNERAALRTAKMQPVCRGQRIASRTTTNQRITQMQPVCRGPRIASRTTTEQLIAQMQPVCRGPHIVSRTTTEQRIAQMQPVCRGPRIARRTWVTRPPRSAHASQYFALVWFGS